MVVSTKKVAPKKKASRKKVAAPKAPTPRQKKPEPRPRGEAWRAAGRINVLDQCLQAGINPVEGIIETRRLVNERIDELESFLRRGGPPPWYLAGEGDPDETLGDRVRRVLIRLREYGTEIDLQIMPYCHPKMKASETTVQGPGGGPVKGEMTLKFVDAPKRKDE